MGFQPFHLSGLGTGYAVSNLSEWNDRAYTLIKTWGYSFDELLSSKGRVVSFDTGIERWFTLPGEPIFGGESLEMTLGEWAQDHGMDLATPQLAKVQPDPIIEAWRGLLREKLAEAEKKGHAMLWVYAEEIATKTGSMIPDHGYGLSHAAVRVFKDNPTFEVYQHTFNRYAGETPKDRYFVIQRRVLPPGISVG